MADDGSTVGDDLGDRPVVALLQRVLAGGVASQNDQLGGVQPEAKRGGQVVTEPDERVSPSPPGLLAAVEVAIEHRVVQPGEHSCGQVPGGGGIQNEVGGVQPRRAEPTQVGNAAFLIERRAAQRLTRHGLLA